MMYISQLRADHTRVMTTYQWHVGEPFPDIPYDDIVLTEFTVQADGDEQLAVVQHIKNIPTTLARVNTWFGDDAKFIVNYLSQNYGYVAENRR